MIKIKIKTGDQVKVLAGDHKGSEGKIVKIFRSKNLAIVEGINMVKKHIKTTKEKKGGIVSKENFIQISNLAIIQQEKKEKKEAKK